MATQPQTHQASTTQTWLTQLDPLMCKLLWVTPQTLAPVAQVTATKQGETAFTWSLAFSAIRCIIKYALLPFVLPLIGLATDAAAPITLAINVLAIITIVASLRRFWQIGYDGRWRYLMLAGGAMIFLAAFLVFDVQAVVRAVTLPR